jgi:hypothetical protein
MSSVSSNSSRGNRNSTEALIKNGARGGKGSVEANNQNAHKIPKTERDYTPTQTNFLGNY